MSERVRLRRCADRARLALLGALILAVTLVVGVSRGSANADPITSCTSTSGVIIVVDFSHFGGSIDRVCDANLTSSTTAAVAMAAEGFTTSGDDYDGPAFVCRINGLPTESDDPCVTTPPATAYWSFWIANPGQDAWGQSPLGVASLVPRPGSVETWIFGAGTPPPYAPSTVRATTVTPTSVAPSQTPSGPGGASDAGGVGATSGTAAPGSTTSGASTTPSTTGGTAATGANTPTRHVEHRARGDHLEGRPRTSSDPLGHGPDLRRRHPHRRYQGATSRIATPGHRGHMRGGPLGRRRRRGGPSAPPAELSARRCGHRAGGGAIGSRRALHPIAWWIWALGLATAASRTTNPLLLCLILAVLAFVVANRRGEAPWARAFKYYLLLALIVVAVRVVFRIVFGGDIVTEHMHVLVRLPHVPLPSWAAGVQLGGPVTLEGTLSALYDGLRLGTLLCCVGAANTLANPKRALRILPGALYELGAAIVVALSIAPQLIESVRRVRRARKLRGAQGGGLHTLRGIAIPVLEDALERSLKLAASMDACGYGRTAGATHRDRRLTGLFLIGGMVGLCIGAYGLLNGSAAHSLGFPALLAGSVLSALGLAVGGRRLRRTQYRPDPWKWPEWVVSATGVVPAVVFLSGVGAASLSLSPSTTPLMWPTLPLVPALAVLVGALAAFAAPPPKVVAPPAASSPPHRNERETQARVCRYAMSRYRHDRVGPRERHLHRCIGTGLA